MSRTNPYDISIIGYDQVTGSKGLSDHMRQNVISRCKVSAEVLSKNLNEFCDAVVVSLSDLDFPESRYELSEFEISVDISLQGELSIIGTLEAGAGSGIKLKFKKKEQ